MKEEMCDFLSRFVTPRRKEKIESAVKGRTRYITVALENIYHRPNASAVLRTCEALGIQDVHIIDNNQTFSVNKHVVQGCSRWLTLSHYNHNSKNNTLEAVQRLRSEGYRIVATTPHRNDYNIEDFDITQGKTALFFGNELEGISDDLENEADDFVKIPMSGFSESLNISVSCAITVSTMLRKLERSNLNWHLSEEDRRELHLSWLREDISYSHKLEDEFFIRNPELAEKRHLLENNTIRI